MEVKVPPGVKDEIIGLPRTTPLYYEDSYLCGKAEDWDTLETISIEKCFLRSNEGIRRFEFYPIR